MAGLGPYKDAVCVDNSRNNGIEAVGTILNFLDVSLPEPALVLFRLLFSGPKIRHIGPNQGGMEVDASSETLQQQEFCNVSSRVDNRSNQLTLRAHAEKLRLDSALEQTEFDKGLGLFSVLFGRLNHTLGVLALSGRAPDSGQKENKLLMKLGFQQQPEGQLVSGNDALNDCYSS